MNLQNTTLVLILVLFCEAGLAAPACRQVSSGDNKGGGGGSDIKKALQALPDVTKLASKKLMQIQESKENIDNKVKDIEFELELVQEELKNNKSSPTTDDKSDADGEGYGMFSFLFLTKPYKKSDKPKPLTAAEKAKLEAEISTLQARLKRAQTLQRTIQRQYEAISSEELTAVVKKVKAFTKNPEFANPLRDNLNEISLRSLPKENKVSILIGNRDSKVEPTTLKEVMALVQDAATKGYYILHDAQSSYASYIAKAAGSLGIALSGMEGQGHQDANSVVIENDYMRMKAYSGSHMVITDPKSLTGLGLLLEGDAHVLLDPAQTLSLKDLDSWEVALSAKGRNLGIKLNLPSKVKTAQEITAYKRRRYGPQDPQLEPVKEPQKFYKYKIEDLPIDFILNITEGASGFAQVMRQNAETQGAVVFGSSRYVKESDTLLYQSIYRLGRQGYAVATGGSGGAMDVANSAAYDAGAISIGIPIGGRNALANEKDFTSSTQTLVIATSGYEQRIPALLNTRKFVIIAPGGGGTIKEIATTFAMLGARDANVQQVIFLDANYYAGLLKVFVSSNLPPSLMNKLNLTNTKEDMEALGQKFQEPVDVSRVQPPRAPDFYTLPKSKEKENKLKPYKAKYKNKPEWPYSDD